MSRATRWGFVKRKNTQREINLISFIYAGKRDFILIHRDIDTHTHTYTVLLYVYPFSECTEMMLQPDVLCGSNELGSSRVF